MIKRASLKKKKKMLKKFSRFSTRFIAIPSSLYSRVHTCTHKVIDKYVTLQRTCAKQRGIFFFFFFSLSVYPRYLSIFWYWFYRLWKQLERNRSPAKEHQDSSEESFETHVRKISANCRIKCSVSWNVYHIYFFIIFIEKIGRKIGQNSRYL